MKSKLKFIRKRMRWENSTQSLWVKGHMFISIAWEAWSYDWYQILRYYECKLYLNTHRYSPTTGAHIHAVRQFLDAALIPYTEITLPMGLHETNSLRIHLINHGLIVEPVNHNIASQNSTSIYRDAYEVYT